MRTFSALVLSALLLSGTATTTLAAEVSTSARSTVPNIERLNDDGGGFSVPTVPTNDESEYERWA
jgi:hypothetical protein